MPGLMWLDEYERAARLAPGFLVLAPVVAVVGFLGFPTAVLPASVAATVLATVGPMVLAKYVGNRGRAAQEDLFASWGGPPTTLMLFPQGRADALCAQRRADVERVTGLKLPADGELDADASTAVDIAIRRVRARASAGTDPRVFAENKSYGFERNLWAARFGGRASAALSLAVVAAAVVAASFGHAFATWPGLLAALVIEVSLALFWVAWPTRDRVREAGDRYAERLLDAVAAM